MNDRGEEWISITDLMAGIVAVMVVMFVTVARQRSAAELRSMEAEQRQRDVEQAARDERVDRERRRLAVTRAILEQVDRDIRENHMEGEAEVSYGERRIRMRDAVFSEASACLSRTARAALARWEPILRGALRQDDRVQLQIEGHTDNAGVSASSLSRAPRSGGRHRSSFGGRCALFSDNYTLSAARASEARKALLGDRVPQAGWTPEMLRRVSVVGFGSSIPRQSSEHNPALNRRVEIRLLDQVDDATVNR